MKKKKKKIIIISILSLLLIFLIASLIYLNYTNKQKINARYLEVYNYAYNTIKDNNNSKELKLKNEDEELIYTYFEEIYNLKEQLKNHTYDSFITQNNLIAIYENANDYITKLDSYNVEFTTKKQKIETKTSKIELINYLKENKCSDKCINILTNKIKESELIFQSEEINTILNNNTEKTNTLKDYIKYLEDNKNSWRLENNKLLIKKDDVLNYINEKNKTFNINITTEKEKPIPKKIPVLMYHGVADATWGLEGLFMKVADFEAQMKYLHDNGFETIFIEDIEKDYTGKKVVALTFDDGYIDFYDNVLPIIKKYNIKTNLYIITSTTSGGLYVNEEQIKELSNSGLVSIGSHTVSHSALATLNAEDIEKELKDSKEYLEKLLGKEMQTISYPTGSHNDTVVNIASKYYKYGLTTISGTQNMSNFNKYKIVRYGLYRNTGMNSFKNMVNNAS